VGWPAAWLVDVDGTLVDSNYHHAIAWSRALRDCGEDARLAAIHRLVGMGGRELLHSLIGRDDEAIRSAWRTHFDALLPEVRPLPGVADLLRAMRADGAAVVLATSSPADLLASMRALLDADGWIDDEVTADDVDRAKPEPDVFAAALAKTGRAAAEALVVGDAVWDVRSAKRAGIRCIGLESGGFSRAELLAEGAVAVYEHPGDLSAHLDEAVAAGAAAR
jgi:HAD superfamily hydrolase (TIGR01509 family)